MFKKSLVLYIISTASISTLAQIDSVPHRDYDRAGRIPFTDYYQKDQVNRKRIVKDSLGLPIISFTAPPGINGRGGWTIPYLIDTTIIYVSGQPALIIHFRDSTDRNYSITELYSNGSIKSFKNFENWRQSGKWVEYYENGQVKSEKYFRLNKLDSTYYFTNRTDIDTLMKVTIDRENLNDIYSAFPFDAFGFVFVQGFFMHYFEPSEKAGIWKWYDQSGKIIRKEKYKVKNAP